MTDSDDLHLEHLDLPCNQFVELVTDYLDGALTAEEQARVDEHLGICQDCTAVLAQWRLVIQVTGELRHDHVEALDSTARAGLMTAFRQARS